MKSPGVACSDSCEACGHSPKKPFVNQDRHMCIPNKGKGGVGSWGWGKVPPPQGGHKKISPIFFWVVGSVWVLFFAYLDICGIFEEHNVYVLSGLSNRHFRPGDRRASSCPSTAIFPVPAEGDFFPSEVRNGGVQADAIRSHH